jgi:formiminotetrahydrofolate cyclodeaminase
MTSVRRPSLKFGTHSTSVRVGGEPNPLTMILGSLNHPASKSILDLTLRDLLQRLGSSDPTPGGGAAAALVGALAAALVEMTANLTIGRPRFADIEDRARRLEQRAAQLRQKLGQLGDADAQAFEQVSTAYKLPRADDAEKADRSRAIQDALLLAAEIPLETAYLAAQVVDVAEEAAPLLNPAVLSDVLVGAVLAQAALESAALNVEINLASLSDPAAIERFSSELARARDGVDARVERTLATGRSRFPSR